MNVYALNSVDVIPRPAEVQLEGNGCLPLADEITVVYGIASLRPVAEQLSKWIHKRCGVACTVASGESSASSGGGRETDGKPRAAAPLLCCVRLQQIAASSSDPSSNAEAYTLEVSSSSPAGEAVISAPTAAGLSRGAATLLQLARRAGEGDRLPAMLRIRDAPAWRWRGVLLDVGRHFYSVAFIKRVLEAMSMLKMNRFHWHLTEDQGWRIEIKAWPRLTQIGAWRGDPPLVTGGYYSQDEVRDIVSFASSLGIDVVPEIELPGHCCAALAAHPDLSCTGSVSRVPTQWGIHEDVYCAGKEAVFDFLESVLGEVAGLFPYEYIHIGGDECPKARWQQCADCQRRIKQEGLSGEDQLQSWFVSRMARHLASLGKKIIGWDEILEGGLPEGATVMSWRGTQGGIIAAQAGHDVIMTPTSHCYFDYRQAQSPSEPGAWYAVLPIDTVYSFDPMPHPAQPPPPPPAAAERSGDTQDTQQPAPRDGSGAGALRQQGGPEEGGGGGGGASGRRPGCSADCSMEEPPQSPDEDRDEAESGKRGRQAEGAQQQQQQQHPPSCAGGEVDRDRILGGQANLWTEYVPDEATAEYMLLPRLSAMAEALW